MKSETIAIHGGYDVDPTTKAVAVPIYQTVAYAFDSADHGAALFNLEVEGFRYTRIGNPTNAVLERRVAALEGGLEALCVSSGQAALTYAALNLTEPGRQHLRPRGAGARGPSPRRPADRRQYGRDPHLAAAHRIRRRHRGAFADEVHGRARHDAGRYHRRQRHVPLAGARGQVSDVQPAGPLVSRAGLRRPFQGGRVHRALPQRLPADDRRGVVAA